MTNTNQTPLDSTAQYEQTTGHRADCPAGFSDVCLRVDGKDDESLYYCPTAEEVESATHGGFDQCCGRPELHVPLPDSPGTQALSDLLSQRQRDVYAVRNQTDDALRERCAAAAARADGQPWNLLMPAEREVYLRVTEAVLGVVQSSYVPPPPGSDRDKLPDHLLALIEMGPYLSTGCETAHALERAIPVHTYLAGELAEWAEREHASCRQTRKQDMAPCRCPHHQARPIDAHLDEVGE